MPIHFKDFFPTRVKKGIFSDKHESMGATVERANQWLAQSGVEFINVETVVLPNVVNEKEALEIGIRTSGEASSLWYQVVRVWYSEKKQESSSPA